MLSFYKEKIAVWSWYDFPKVSSTNDTIKEFSTKEMPVVVSAIEQTGGRGRRGRKWEPIAGNLYFTYSLEIPLSELSRYVCLIGLSLAKTIQGYTKNQEIKIKWPNDVFFAGKKITGILLEKIQGDIWAVGIGVNIVDSPKISNLLYEATSLKEEGIITDRVDFLHRYLEQFKKDLSEYKEKGFGPLKDEWQALALNIGQQISIKNETLTKTGIFLKLDDNGYLILKTDKGEDRIVAGDLFMNKEK